jgi:hypothetical protein
VPKEATRGAYNAHFLNASHLIENINYINLNDPANTNYTFTLRASKVYNLVRRCNLCQTLPPSVLDIYPRAQTVNAPTAAAAAALCVLMGFQLRLHTQRRNAITRERLTRSLLI